MAQACRLAEITDLQFPLIVHAKHVSDERLKTICRQMADETGAETFVKQQRATMTRLDSRPGLAAIKCSTLVLVGDGDMLTPPALAEEMAAGIAGSRLVVVPDSGHLSTLEQPGAVNAALADWIKGP
jgi:pimeloyl-ACP methyl ester carboxylesterase